MKETLYELTGQFKELQALADGADEDVAIAVRDTMQGIQAEFNEKALAVSRIVLNLDSDVGALDAEIARLTERKRLITNRQKQITDYLRENMEAAGISKITCPLFTITLVKAREIAIIDNPDLLPDDMTRVKTDIQPDKPAILKALKAGKDVPGAHVELGKTSIRIK